MQAAVLEDERTVRIETRDRPTPEADAVVVRIEHVGICGSDVHYYEHGHNGDNELDVPTIMGHESAGTIVETGADVTGSSVGDRVALEPGVPCGSCRYCDIDEYNLCGDVRFMASPPDDGALVEYVAWPAQRTYSLPESVSTRAGALCEPLSVAIHANRRGNVGSGDTVLVTGCGPIGLLCMDAAYAAGAEDVIVADIVERKLELATERGAAHAIRTDERSLVDAVDEFTDGGVDVVLECSGAEAVIDRTVESVRKGGQVVFVGLPQDPELPTDVFGLIDNELDISGSFRFRNTYAEAIDLLASGAVEVESLVDFELPLVDTRRAFERAADPEVVKGMIAVNGT
jgi:L-iditol 2-dehydrogenase